MLSIEDLHAYYGMSHILQGVSLDIAEGEAVSLLGRNGAGKTTLLLALMGYLKPRPGKIRFRGKDISRLPPYRVSRLGLGFVPQERGIFPSLSVDENLTVAARGNAKSRWRPKDIYALFPRLDERRSNRGNQLSGGEQQMLAIGRALLLNPVLLVLDEPSEGLAPLIVEDIVKTLRSVREDGLSILLVEQNISVAFDVADRHYILSKGAVCFEGTASEIKSNDAILTQHLGI
jgi:branched-chain amino acid transport system ATP-binding protein